MANIDINDQPIVTLADFLVAVNNLGQFVRIASDAGILMLTGGTLTGPLTLSGDPVGALDAATKQFVENAIQGLSPKQSARLATTANHGLTGLAAIDGVTPIAGDRILVKSNTSAPENGLYVAAAGAWARSPDANTWDELVSAYVFVQDGSANGDKAWLSTANAGGTLGVTNVTWVAFGSLAGYAPLDSPTFINNPTAPTQTLGTNNTTLANMAALFAQAAILEPLGKYVAVDRKTASYVLTLADIGHMIEMNVASANTLTIPPQSSVAWPAGARIDSNQYGAGATTWTAGAGVTLRSNGAKLKSNGQYAVSGAYRIAADEWEVYGNLTT